MVGRGTFDILALAGECGGVVFGGRFPTNNELVNVAPSTVADEGAHLLHLSGGIGRGSIPFSMGERPWNQKEHQ